MAGNAETQTGYIRAVERAQQTQTCRWALAPGCTVHTAKREDKREGDQVTRADFAGNSAVLRELTQLSVLIEVPEDELHRRRSWAESTHRVNPEGKALIASKGSGRGILSPGEPCDASCFASKAVPEYQTMGAYGVVVTVPAKEADDGTKTLKDLVAKGCVVERPKRLGRKAGK
jgi:hypothetical protein